MLPQLNQGRWLSLRHNLRAARLWRGQQPRVYLRAMHQHSIWAGYETRPPLRYAPYPIAQLCHWVDCLPRVMAANKDHIFEIEHLLAMTPDRNRWMSDPQRVWSDNAWMHSIIGAPNCKTVFTFSNGLVEHCQRYLRPEVWPKLDFVYPAYASQHAPERPVFEPETGEPFTILIIASRWSDKGVPEALRAYKILRARHGERVRLNLVSREVPSGFELPPGVTHWNTPRLTKKLKRQLYHAADVLLNLCYSDMILCFIEAAAYGVPSITNRIHNGEEFVRDGVTGFLLPTPVFYFSDGFATRWKTWEEFLAIVETRRAEGGLESVVEAAVHRVEAMMSGQIDLAAMRQQARRFHAERFTPQERNRKILRLYTEALRP